VTSPRCNHPVDREYLSAPPKVLQQSRFFVYDKPPISIKILPRANEYDSYDREKGVAKSFLYSEKRETQLQGGQGMKAVYKVVREGR
jgi:hypothetical protein